MNENFNDFFIWKIQAIRNELREMQSQGPILAQEFNMMPVSCSTVKNTIQSLSTKTCSIDPLPAYVIKNYVLS